MATIERSAGKLAGEGEARLRIIATVCATIILGWAIYSGATIPSAAQAHSRGQLLVAIAGCFWSLVWSGWVAARAFGQAISKSRSMTWTMALSYSLNIPFISLLRNQLERDPEGFARVRTWTPTVLLGVVSVLVLCALAITGWRFETRRTTS